METGLKTIQKTNNLKSHIKKELSIQISLSGLSFCILNRSDSKIDYLKHIDFKSILIPETVLEKLQKTISDDALLTQPFDAVLVLFQNELSNLVPEALFEENNAADYLKFSSKIIKTDFISFDKIEVNKSVNVFVPYVNINNYLFEVYGEFEYKHASTIFLEQILETEDNSSDNKMYLNVAPFHFEMAVVKKDKLQLYNTFDYYTKEDFIYFVLFSIEQLKLDPENLIIKLSGNIAEDDALYQLLYTYIRHVKFNEPTIKHSYDEVLDGCSKHRHLLILNSFD